MYYNRNCLYISQLRYLYVLKMTLIQGSIVIIELKHKHILIPISNHLELARIYSVLFSQYSVMTSVTKFVCFWRCRHINCVYSLCESDWKLTNNLFKNSRTVLCVLIGQNIVYKTVVDIVRYPKTEWL